MTRCTTLATHHTALHHASQVLRDAYDTYERTGNEVEECEHAWQLFAEARDAYHIFAEKEVEEVEGVGVKNLTRRGAMLMERVRGLVPDVKFDRDDCGIVSVDFEGTQASPEQLYVAISLLPNEFTGLYCYNTNLTSLPKLPDSLTELFCFNTNLTTLPELPNGLTRLDCSDTKITSLPELPDGLTRLNCYNTQLTTLPELPDTLTYLNYWNTPASKDPGVIAQLEAFKKAHPGAEIHY